MFNISNRMSIYATDFRSVHGKSVKRPGFGIDHPPSFSAEVKETVEIYFYTPFGPSWTVLG